MNLAAKLLALTGAAVVLTKPIRVEGSPGAGSIELVYQGQPKAIVVIAENPTRPAHVAAKEFIHYIKKITGAELPLYVDGVVPKREWAPRRVLIGESSLTREYGLRNADFQPQEYLIETRGTDLILMGHDAEEYGLISYEENGTWPTAGRKRSPLFTPMGSLYAVDMFLEKFCGVRWYLPGAIGEVCPTQPALRFQNAYLRTKPWAVHRWSSRLGHPDPFQFYEGQADYTGKPVSGRDDLLFQLRMKIGGEPYVCNHSFYSYYNRFGKTHPEWWTDNKPDPHLHLDYLNPQVIQQAAQDATDYFDGKFPTGKYPDGSGVMATDGYCAVMPLDRSDKWVMTREAKKLFRTPHRVVAGVPLSDWAADWASEYYFTVVNRVAAKVRRKHPDKWITASAYAAFFRPPETVKLEPNISIQVCNFITTTFHEPTRRYCRETLDLWSQRVNDLRVWEYYQTQAFAGFKHFPVIHPRHTAEGIRFMQEKGVRGYFFEDSGSPSWIANPAEQMLNRYITWKYLCDTSRSVDEILDEHFRLFYGPAANVMQKYFSLIESRWEDSASWAEIELDAGWQARVPRSWTRLCPPEILAQLTQLIRTALQMDLPEPYRTRVELIHRAIHERMERHAGEFHHRLAARPRLACLPAAAAPVIDGALTDAAWNSASVTADFVAVYAQPASVSTRARVLRDDQNLYVAFACAEPAPVAPADAGQVEVLLDVGRTRQKSVRFVVTAADQLTGPEARAAVARRAGGYDVELAIPLKSLGVEKIVSGEAWGINFGRVRPHLPAHSVEPARTVWSPTFTARNLDRPAEFGVLTFDGESALPVIHYDFEQLESGSRFPDRAGVAVRDGRQFSPAVPKNLPGGTPLSVTNLVEGVRGRGLRFDGESAKQWLEVALAPGVNLATDDFTIAFWFKTESPGGNFLSSTTSSPSWQLGMFHDKKKGGGKTYPRLLLGTAGGGATVSASDTTSITDGQWHHYVMMLDRGRLARVYVDGKLAGIGGLGGITGPLKNALTIGGPYAHVQGVLDEFFVFRGSYDQPLVDRLYQTAR